MLRGTRCDSTCSTQTKCSIPLPALNTTDHRVYFAAASHVATCTYWAASIRSLSVLLLPHTSCMLTTACTVHCTCSIPFHLSECDGPRRAPVATAQYEAHMCTAEAPVTHSLCTDMTARPARLNASGLTLRQHVQHPNQMQYTTACSQHDGSPRVLRRSQPCDYVHILGSEHPLSECTATAAHIVHEHHSLHSALHV
jgi:hypothetical protein